MYEAPPPCCVPAAAGAISLGIQALLKYVCEGIVCEWNWQVSALPNYRDVLCAGGSTLLAKVVSPADSCEAFGCDSGIQPG